MSKFLITLFFGWSGAHKFMEKKIGVGILYLFTFGLFGVGWIVDSVHAYRDISKSAPSDSNPIELSVAGTYYRKDNIASILNKNRLYNSGDDIFIEKAKENKRIYKYNRRKTNAVLVPEPTNEHDHNAIKVVIDNVHVGYIPDDQCIEIKKIMNKISNIIAEIYGGDYKYHSCNSVYKCEGSFYINLIIT